MEVIVVHRFYGVEDGKVQPRWHEVGDIVRGDLAQAAIDGGNAQPAKKRTAPAPENLKTSSASQPGQALPEKTPKKRGRQPKQSS